MLQGKKTHRPITHQMCWFSGTGGDRTLDQQAISLPSGRVTHRWTGCMQKQNIHSFQVVPTEFSLHCSLLLCSTLLPCPTIFLSVPLERNCSYFSPTFPPLLSLVSWLTILNVWLCYSPSARPAVSWSRYGGCGSLHVTHRSLRRDDLMPLQ